MELKGAVAQVLGPVVDVEFPGGKLPEINEAMSVTVDGETRMMEVAQHVGGGHRPVHHALPQRGAGPGGPGGLHRHHHPGPGGGRRPWAGCSTSWASPSTKRAR